MPSKTLVINCGASHVAAAIFSAAGGKLTLESLDTRDVRYDVAKDEAWLPAVAEGLRDLARSNSKFRGKATFILPGYQLLVKPIKVPHVEAAKQSQIIAFEAQNNIPFPLTEAVWGSQVIADDGIETEVLLAAQKADAANRFCGLMASIGLQPISLQPSSLLDFNAYKLVYGTDAEDTLMINIGARSTNLTFVSPAGLFIRNVNIGGNTLTQALADTTGKPFNQAEDLKIEFYTGQTSFEADNPVVSQLQTKAQDFMKRLSQQITQSIIAYRRASNRAAPVRILLTGRASLLSGLPEFLSESQKVSVDYFNPSSVVSLASRVDQSVMDQHYYQISEIVGEAARLAKSDAFGINLLPQRIRQRLVFEKQKPFLVLAAACLALAPLPMLYKSQQELGMITRERQQWDVRTSQLKDLSAEIQQDGAKAQDIRGEIAQYENLMNSRFNWTIFFSQLQAALVDIKDVWLDGLEVVREAPKTAPSRMGSAAAKLAAMQPPPAAAISYKLNIKGRMLLRDIDPDAPNTSEDNQKESIARIHLLMSDFSKIPFVKEVDENSFIPDLVSDPRMVGFQFTVIIDPEHPL
jgi:type IV pilus assembly protein PilM